MREEKREKDKGREKEGQKTDKEQNGKLSHKPDAGASGYKKRRGRKDGGVLA